jgi:hypothetical protein
VIHSPYATTPTLNQLGTPANPARVTLAPDPLAVSCERIKAGVLRELDLSDHWRGKVQVWIRPRLRVGTPPGFEATRYADGWQYKLDLAEEIEPSAVVRGVVLALLTELANRQAGPRAAELPLWLVEGLSARLMGTVGPDLVVVPTPLQMKLGGSVGQLDTAPRTHVGAENLAEIRAWFLGRSPLTFAEIGQPSPAQLVGEAYATYRHSAELLVYKLQCLRQGRRCLALTVFGLTRSLNWQTAFLRAFGSHFDRLLDVEKWWTVTTQSFLQGDQPNSWPRSVSLDKLADLLRVRVEVQDRPGAPRRASDFSLQEFMARTTFAGHQAAVGLRRARLQALQRTAAPETVPLVRNYLTVLDDYLRQRSGAGRAGISKRVPALPLAYVLRETTRRLDELDRQREQLRRMPETPVAATAGSPGERGF